MADEKLPPRLDALPEELISNIAGRLDYDELSQLRLVCKWVEAKSFHDFATEYFSAKSFMFTTESLNALVSIAENVRLRDYLHTVYLTTAMFSDAAFKCPNGGRCVYQPSVRQAEAYKFYIQDQKRLKEKGEDKALLIKALSQLTKVRTLRLADTADIAESIGRIYPIRRVARRCAREPSFAPSPGTSKDVEYVRWMTHVWKTMCQAVAESGIASIERFGTDFRDSINGLSVSQDLRLGPKTLAGLREALKDSVGMHLTIRAGTLVKRGGAPDREASAAVMKNFAGVVRDSKLTGVTIGFDTTASSGFLYAAFMKKLNLGQLKKVSLDGTYIAASSLVTILKGMSPSIEDLRISWTNLTTGSWVPALEVIKGMGQLNHLHMMWLQQDGRKVYLLEQRDMEDEDALWDDIHGHDDELDEDDTDDDEIPDLEPAGGVGDEAGSAPAATADSVLNGGPMPGAPLAATDLTADQAMMDEMNAFGNEFVAPGREGDGERGYYVCLEGKDQIAKWLPTFVKEYNLGDDVNAPPPMLQGPGGIGAMFNTLFGGPPPPMAGGGHHHHQGAPPAGHGPNQAHGHAQGGAHGPGPGHGHGPVPHGPPPPPGFVSLGHGPGYSMMMGAMPVPMPGFFGGGQGAGAGPHPGAAAGGGTAGGQAQAGAAAPNVAPNVHGNHTMPMGLPADFFTDDENDFLSDSASDAGGS